MTGVVFVRALQMMGYSVADFIATYKPAASISDVADAGTPLVRPSVQA